MTDLQFKGIFALCYEMIDKCKTYEEVLEAKKAIAHLAGDSVLRRVETKAAKKEEELK